MRGMRNAYVVLCLLLTSAGAVSAEFQLTVDGGSGSGLYETGSNVVVVAELRDGFYFSHWTGDREVPGDLRDARPTFVMPDRNLSLTANYLPVQEFTYNPDQVGTVGAPAYGISQTSSNYLLTTQNSW